MASQFRLHSFEGSHLSSTTFPYPIPPLVYENNQMVSVTFKTSPDVLREMDITLQLGEPVSPAPPSTFSVILMKSIPSVKGGSTYDVKQLTTALVRDSKDSEVNPGEAKLSLGSTVSDPLGMIPVVEVISGVHTIGGFVLDYGEVVYDYLSQ